MTVEELCEAFSRTISIAFDQSRDEFARFLLTNVTEEKTEMQNIAEVIRNSIYISANLAAQVTVSNFAYMGIITEEQLVGWKLRPPIQLVTPSDGQESSPADQKGPADPGPKILDFEPKAVKVHREDK